VVSGGHTKVANRCRPGAFEVICGQYMGPVVGHMGSVEDIWY
jgi:hypothetical protein